MQFTPTQKRAAAWTLIALLACWPCCARWARCSRPSSSAPCWLTRSHPWWTGSTTPAAAACRACSPWCWWNCCFSLALAGLVLLVVPILVKEVPLMREQLPVLFDRLDATLRPWLAQFGIHVALDVASLKSQVLKYLQANYEDFASSRDVLAQGRRQRGASRCCSTRVLIPVALFYLLLDWDRFVHRVLELVPPRARPAVDSFTDEADQVLGQYLRGQLLVMLTMAIFYAIGLSLFGLDLALADRRLHRAGDVRALPRLRHRPGARRCWPGCCSSPRPRRW